jgi:hypothetical protein
MSAPDRAVMRGALATLLSDAGEWQAVYDCQPKTFGGQSPVATIHNGPANFEFLAAGHAPVAYSYEFIITNHVRRGPDDAENAAEAALDALLEAVLDVVDENRRTDEWTLLDLAEMTAPDYYMVDGVQYRAEAIRVRATVRQ